MKTISIGLLKIAIPFFIILPIFFQLSTGIYIENDLHRYFNTGVLSTLPLPLSIIILYVGILIIAQYKQAKISSIFLISSCILLTIATYIATVPLDLKKEKILLLLQFILPFSALILGQMYISVWPESSLLCAKIFLIVLVYVIPLELFFTYKLHLGFLSSNVGFFSIYQHLQYVPVIFVNAYLFSMFNLWSSLFWRKLLILFFPCITLFTSASISRMAFLYFFSGLALFIIFEFRRFRFLKIPKALIILFILGLTSHYVYFNIHREKIHFKFPTSIGGMYFIHVLKNAIYTKSFLPITQDKNISGSVRERIIYWQFYTKSITKNIKSLLFGNAVVMNKKLYPSAHNYFLDFIFNFGIIALLPFLILIIYTISLVLCNCKAIFDSAELLILTFSFLFTIFIDNAIKVGMRQPYSGIFTFFLWGMLLTKLNNNRQTMVVGRAGFEPATNGLKVRCSTN